MTPITDARIQRGVRGAVVAVAWLMGLYAGGPLVDGFGLTGIAQSIINSTPGWFSSTMIGLLGFWAQPVLLASLVLGVVSAAAVVGVAWPRLPLGHDAVPIVIGVLVTLVLFASIDVESSVAFVGGVIIAVAPPYLAARILDRQSANRGSNGDRRGFLVRSAAVVGGVVFSLGIFRIALTRRRTAGTTPGGEPLTTEDSAAVTEETEFDFGGMPSAVTPPDDHYVIDINLQNPSIDIDSWTLDIDGVVSEPYSLTHEELLDHDESVEMVMTMVCISNRVGGELIGTSRWTGVQLSDLVAAADPDETAVDVVTHATDGYSEAIPIEQVQREDILLAYGMGDRTLTRDHGFPTRLLIPGRYGMKMTKWITDIEIADADHEAYWEDRGWDEEAVVNLTSYIRASERNGDRVTVGGVAFGGLETGIEEIDAVEVSVDGGETWHAATLEEMIAPHAWRRWKYDFDAPERTQFNFVCRAIRRDGTVQTSEEASPRPSGSTGWHEVTKTL